MFSLSAISFLSPWVLVALVTLPVLYFILRVTPPRPKTQELPSFFLLADLQTDVKSAARTPWWLLVLRMMIILFFILALADPLLRADRDMPGGTGNVVIVVDNGWGAAANIEARRQKIIDVMTRIRQSGRAVMVIPTAPSPQDGNVRPTDVMSAAAAEKYMESLRPLPWPTDHTAAREAFETAAAKTNFSHAVFFSDGMAPSAAATENLVAALREKTGRVTVVHDQTVNKPFVLRRHGRSVDGLSFDIETVSVLPRSLDMSLVAYDTDGNVVDEHRFDFPAGHKITTVVWPVAVELRNRIARINIKSVRMASAVYLTDSRWMQYPVGIVADPARMQDAGYLGDVFYLRRALESATEPVIDMPENLVQRDLSAIVWPDSAAMTVETAGVLADWVDAGGLLIRFAGANLAANPNDGLLPVPLRHGQRAMQGAMTWEKPQRLSPIEDSSPLYGLTVPEDVTVSRQVLADPVPEVFEKTWLRLEDGTPLVTGGGMGRGMIVLIHTTAGPEWSDFSYSGLYVEMLQRIIAQSTGTAGYKGDGIVPPFMLMDGIGHLHMPDKTAIAGAVDPQKPFQPAPATPPGLYGNGQNFRVYNLGDHLPPVLAVPDLRGVTMETYQSSGALTLKIPFLKIAILLLLLDTVLTLILRGVLTMPRMRTAVFLLTMAAGLAAAPVYAQNDDGGYGIVLAYVETGDQATDSLSYNGLQGLAQVVNTRTNIRVRGVRAVDPAIDDLHQYPLIYWPMTENRQGLSATAAQNMQRYMAEGGMVLFDTRDRQYARAADDNINYATIGTRALRAITQNIRIAELMKVEKDHILTKSFYLLEDFPGAFAGGDVWVEKEPDQNNDSVTAVVIGGNDWAAAWTQDARDRNRYPVTPGGEDQREYAYRFGINLLMMATAGNYKSDQIHVSHILERIGR